MYAGVASITDNHQRCHKPKARNLPDDRLPALPISKPQRAVIGRQTARTAHLLKSYLSGENAVVDLQRSGKSLAFISVIFQCARAGRHRGPSKWLVSICVLEQLPAHCLRPCQARKRREQKKLVIVRAAPARQSCCAFWKSTVAALHRFCTTTIRSGWCRASTRRHITRQRPLVVRIIEWMNPTVNHRR